MAKKLGEFFTELAAMAGIAATDPRLKDVQSIMTEVSDDLITEFTGKITSIEAAKNNSVLKSFFTARALNPIDEILEEKLADAGFSDAEIAAIKADTSTPKKLRSFIDGLKKQKASAPAGDKAALQQEIDKLQGLLANAATEKTSAISAAEKKANESILEYAIDSILSGMPYANKDLDLDVNVLTAKGVIQKALADKKAKVVRMPDNTLKLVQSENPDLDYFNEQHQPVKFSDFTKSTLAAKKMLITSDPANPPAPGTNPKFTPPAPGGTDNVALKEAIKNAKAAYTNGSSVVQGN